MTKNIFFKSKLQKSSLAQVFLQWGIGFQLIHKIFKFIGAIHLFLFVIGCNHSISVPVDPLEEYEKPSCASSNASSSDIKRRKSELFRLIENSNRYSNSEARKQSLERYKKLVATKEKTDCPQDVIQFIDKVSDLHRE